MARLIEEFQATLSQLNLGGVLEILLLWCGIYVMLRFLRGTRGFGVFRGLVFFILAALIGVILLDAIFAVPRLNHMMQVVTPWIALILTILFQPELRHGISRLGHTGVFSFFSRVEERDETIRKVAAAAQRMAKERTGALIAFERGVSLAPFRENAAKVDAPVSSILLESIFFHGNPLHDGAVILKGDIILAAACLLPLTENPEVQRRMGTRHRAALGLTEESDAVTLVVSEETGHISLACAGLLYQQVPFDQLEDRLRELLQSEVRKTARRETVTESAIIATDKISLTESSIRASRVDSGQEPASSR